MIMVNLLVFCLFLFSIVYGDTCVDNPPSRDCVSSCVECRRWKCSEAAKENRQVDCSKQSPYIGGNQCCNMKTLSALTRKKRQAYNFDNEPNRKWPNPIGFYIDSTISSNANFNANIRNALSYIQAQTCIRFTEITAGSTTPYVNYTRGSSCTAYVGRSDFTSTPITTTNDCLSEFGEMLYYTVQTLGMWHQTQRPDRDQYVTINTTNVDPAHTTDFNIIQGDALVTLGLPYDMASIKHFPPTVYSSNGLFTILTNEPLYQQTIGQRVQLSFQDSKLLNLLYCKSSCSSSQLTSTCQNGGYQDPNNCTQCRCPDGFSGQYCDQYETASGGVCGGSVDVTPTELYITSPGYYSPQYYDPQIACAWHLTSSVGGKIQMKFVDDFGLHEDNSKACYHWVEIRYKGSMNETGPRFCGKTLPQVTLTAYGPEAMVIFRSNMSNVDSSERRGFRIAYKVVDVASTVPSSAGPPQPSTSTSTVFPTNGLTSGLPPASTEFAVGPTSTVPTAASSPPPTSCNPNPCRNNGTCVASGGSVSCQCINGFTGVYCTNAPCGGCNISPGVTDAKCMVPEVPTRTCQKQSGSRITSSFWTGWCIFSCTRNKKRQPVATNVTCTWSVCCDNAVDIGPGCAVIGWSKFCGCSASCGGGMQGRTQWGFRTDRNGRRIYAAIATDSQPCNTQPCSCPYRSGSWWKWDRQPCQTCNPPFVLSNGQCVKP